MRTSTNMMVLVAWLLLFSVNITVLSLPPLVIPIQKELAFNFTQAGFLISLPVLVLSILAVGSGFLADRFGTYRMLTSGVVLIAVGSFLRGFTNSFIDLMATISIFAVGYGLMMPNLPKFVAENFPETLRARISGYYTTGLPIGATAGLALTTPLFEATGSWRSVYVLLGIVPISVAAGWLTLARHQWRSSANSERSSLIFAFRSLTLWVVGLIAFMMSTLFFIEAGWFPTLLTERGVTPTIAGIMVSTFTIANMAGVLLIPYLSDKYGARKPFLWITGLTSALAAFFLISSPIEASWALIPILGLSQAAPFVFMFVLPTEIIKSSAVGTASGMVISIGFAGGVFGPWLVGYLRDATGSFLLVPFILILASLTISGLTFALPETGPKRKLT